MTADTISLPTWYSDGLRWIASLITRLADAMDRRSAFVPLSHAEQRQRRAMEDYLDDLRFRMHSGY